jgi:hypothetical protein
MGGALKYDQFALFAFADEFIDESVFLVNASAPATFKIPKRFRLADASVAVALNVLDKLVDSLKRLFVSQLAPAFPRRAA